MGLSTAHIFYIPVILMVGIFAGYFLGRQAAEKEAAELKKRRARRKALRDKAKEASPPGDAPQNT
ncbi:MAG: hypothetical protein ACLFVJ_07235 [Persicimonas sp.]